MNTRVLAAVAAGALCAGIGSTAFAAGTATEVDAVDAMAPGSYAGTIGPDEADWYVFHAVKGDVVSIDLSGDFDTYLNLYSTHGPASAGDLRDDFTLVDHNDDISFPSNLNSHLDYQVTKSGFFVAAAEGFSSSNGTYAISISVDGGHGPSECPTGWDLQWSTGPDDPFDENGDGWICTQQLPNDNDKAQGNSANTNRDGDQDPNGHLDGHNHMDNRV